MPISSLTGTQNQRIEEIQQRHLVFEPPTSSKLYKNPLYTVPMGQTFAAEMTADTGSFLAISGAIHVEKVVHIFENETEASQFINSTGQQNISSIVRRPFIRENGSIYYKVEVQLVNYPQIKIPLSLAGCEIQRGFKVEVFLSGANGFREIDDLPVFNIRGDLISDTYLKYFEIVPE
jgi:hypothetical protein